VIIKKIIITCALSLSHTHHLNGWLHRLGILHIEASNILTLIGVMHTCVNSFESLIVVLKMIRMLTNSLWLVLWK
jgi:hypothetical protein